MSKIQMTEPLVIPKPKTKPVPKRKTPKPKPRENDPWTVPAPKVNPTPKAIILKTTVMSLNKNKEGKVVIDSKSQYDLMRSMTTREKFFAKFELSTRLVTRLAAEKAMAYAAFNDVCPLYIAQEGRRSAML